MVWLVQSQVEPLCSSLTCISCNARTHQGLRMITSYVLLQLLTCARAVRAIDVPTCVKQHALTYDWLYLPFSLCTLIVTINLIRAACERLCFIRLAHRDGSLWATRQRAARVRSQMQTLLRLSNSANSSSSSRLTPLKWLFCVYPCSTLDISKVPIPKLKRKKSCTENEQLIPEQICRNASRQ